MDINPTNQQSISDDQELAKVLAGINGQGDDAADAAAAAPVMPEPVAAPSENDAAAQPESAAPTTPEVSQPEPAVEASPAAPSQPMGAPDAGDLTSIKNDALQELRPLVDKLDVSPEEKFDTYLLLLRSTDDRTLISPAHDAAKSITDEARRAQALLDIIKEIDFLSQPQQ